MKKTLQFLFIVFPLFIVLPTFSFALNCSSPPTGPFGPAWARAYESWCQQCGGIYNPSSQSCTPGPNWGGRSGSTSPGSSSPSSYEVERQRLEAEKQRQQEIEEQRRREEIEAKRGQREFERNKVEALRSLKGISKDELGLKEIGTDTALKGIEDTTQHPEHKKIVEKKTPAAVDSLVANPRDNKKSYNVNFTAVKGVNPKLRQELLGNFPDIISKRNRHPNKQAQNILQSLKNGEPPNPIKNIADLAPGDVILVASSSWKDRKKEGEWEVGKSIGINFLDKWSSNNWSSPVSHAAIFLGKRNGKRWYFNNTFEHGPVIVEEKDFLREYGQRSMDVATLVGQPLSQHEGQELWKGAHELRNTTTYGIWANDKMVCSEASRWLLLRAGRRVPETRSENVKIKEIDTGLNKKQFVNFSPSDFYEEQQYFVVHQLGLQKIGQKSK
jgi:hypothetical protein